MTSENIFFDLSQLAFLGKHTIIGKTVRIRQPARVSIGDYTIIDDFSYISCALTVGRYTHIGAGAAIIGSKANVFIGDFVNLAPACRLVAGSNDFSGGGLAGSAIPGEFADDGVAADIRLADHVLLGTNTVVLPGTSVPEGVSTGALTLLTPKLNLKPWTLYTGIPARPIRKRESSRILESARRLLL